MVGNRSYNNRRRTLCLDCTNPACTALDCTTWTICRNPGCKRKDRCEKRAAPLNSSQYPKSMADQLSFRCSACHKMKCSHCKRAATRYQHQRHRRKNASEAWICGELPHSRSIARRYAIAALDGHRSTCKHGYLDYDIGRANANHLHVLPDRQ